MTGRRWTAAQFIASWKSPRDVEPSPNHVIAARRSPRSLKAIAMPVATSIMSGSIETIPTHPSRHAGGEEHHAGQHRDHPDSSNPPVAEVHVAVAPAGHAARAPHVLAEDP